MPSPTRPPQPSAALLFGGGRYLLRSSLGSRPNGGVFLATDRSLGRPCALKLLDASEAPAEAVERFLAEARALRDVRHPHVIHAWDHGRDHGMCWYAMEHLPGGTLAEPLRTQGRIPPEHALSLTFQVLMGLHAVHQAGLVHRDIKLTNVMLDLSGNARLTDFGVARHPEGTVDFETIPGQALGTPGYGAPEQWGGEEEVAAGADLFATGVLLYRMLTRSKPQNLHLAHYRPSLLQPVPEAIRPLLLTATRFVPAERFADAREMAEAVAETRTHWSGGGAAEVREWMARFEDTEGDWREAWSGLRSWLLAATPKLGRARRARRHGI